MDETGLYLLLGLLGIVATIIGIWGLEWRRQRRRAQIAQSWPITEATIESGRLEAVTDSRARSPIVLPVFAFSYEVEGNYYSGRFSLSHLDTEADELIRRLIGRKIQIRWNPPSPNVWFIPETQIEGCKVEQKVGPHMIALYPRE